MKQKYHTLNELIEMMEKPNRKICHKLLDDNKELFRIARGSGYNHQAWEGGYIDHLTEIMNIAKVLYSPLDELRKLPFSLSDSLLVLYLHDLEKPWKYIKDKNGWRKNPDLKDKEKQIGPFIEKKIKEYGFVLSDIHLNGLKYVEGEKNNYSQTNRIQSPLAAFAHLCDTWSARGWYNFPTKENDPWQGARRS